jgi:hypothetical protein
LVPVPWSRRVWALPFLTTLARPADQHGRNRHKTSIDWVRHMLKQVHRWLHGRKLGLVVDGGLAAGPSGYDRASGNRVLAMSGPM